MMPRSARIVVVDLETRSHPTAHLVRGDHRHAGHSLAGQRFRTGLARLAVRMHRMQVGLSKERRAML